MNQNEPIQHQAAKVVTLWAGIGITSWADAASFAAFLYSLVLLGEWAWKRFLRDFGARRGWWEAPKRDAGDTQ